MFINNIKFSDNKGVQIEFNGLKFTTPYNTLYIVQDNNSYIFYNKDKPLFSCTSFTIDENPGTIESFCNTFYKKSGGGSNEELQKIYTAYNTYVSTEFFPSNNTVDGVCTGLQNMAGAVNEMANMKGATPASIKMEDGLMALGEIPSLEIGQPTVLMNTYIDDASKYLLKERPENAFNNVTFYNTVGQFRIGEFPPYGWNYKVFNNCKVEGTIAAPLFSDDYWGAMHYINDIFTNCKLSIWSILQPKFKLLTNADHLFDGIVFDGKDYEIEFNSQQTMSNFNDFCNLYPTAPNSGSLSIRFPHRCIKESNSTTRDVNTFGSYIKYLYGPINSRDQIGTYYLGCGPNHLPSDSNVKNYGNFIGWKNLDGTWYGLNDILTPNFKTSDERIFIGGKKVSQEWIAAIADGLKARLGSCTITLDSEVLAAIPADIQAKFTAKHYVLKGV